MNQFRTYELAKCIYKEAKNLKFDAIVNNQFQRALLSMCLNISEGSGRATKQDRARFYSIALGSLREVQAILDLFAHKELHKKADILGAMLYRLIRNPGALPT